MRLLFIPQCSYEFLGTTGGLTLTALCAMVRRLQQKKSYCFLDICMSANRVFTIFE